MNDVTGWGLNESRIKNDLRWGTGVWLGRHSASDAHLIGTPGGVIQVRTVRRLTLEQRSDDVSKRALDNFIGSPRNLSGSKPSLEEQTAHGEKWTLTPGCKGCIWARRGYHHTKACKAKKWEFLLTKARSEELRAAEADAWRKPANATEPSSSARPSGSAREEGAQPEPVDEQPQPQPDVGDSEMAVTARRRQTLKRFGGRVLWPRGQTLQFRPRECPREDANLEQTLASVDADSRVRPA